MAFSGPSEPEKFPKEPRSLPWFTVQTPPVHPPSPAPPLAPSSNPGDKILLPRPQLSLGPASPDLHPKAKGPLCCPSRVGQPLTLWGQEERGDPPNNHHPAFSIQQGEQQGPCAGRLGENGQRCIHAGAGAKGVVLQCFPTLGWVSQAAGSQTQFSGGTCYSEKLCHQSRCEELIPNPRQGSTGQS